MNRFEFASDLYSSWYGHEFLRAYEERNLIFSLPML
jgi:hypothetical protein